MIKRVVLTMFGLCLVFGALYLGFLWTACRIYVPPDKCAVLTRKTGAEPKNKDGIAQNPGEKGIQEQVLGPGRYFYNPYTWDWKLFDLTVIQPGGPATWEWVHSLSDRQRDQLRAGTFKFTGQFPQVGVVARKVGPEPPDGPIVDRASGQKGIWREVLTPGTYKLNPFVYHVEVVDATVIPAGFVGVVTNQFGDEPQLAGWMDDDPADIRLGATTPPQSPEADGAGEKPSPDVPADVGGHVRPLARPGERGTLRDVLQPGVYFINPKLQKVHLIEIGFNEYSQVKISEAENYRISFPSDTGYTIRVGVTVVWGIDPRHAAEIINEFGNIDRVLDKVIGPQLRSICRNIGSQYSARDFIRGEKREEFQRDMTAELQRVCRQKNIEIIIALVREIEVHAPAAGPGDSEVTEDLKRTIQESYIAIEKQITKEKQREAAVVRAELEEERKKVDIAQETIKADTRVLVADELAGGEKEAATIDAQTDLEVAAIQQEIARLDAQRTEILGQANADVERMKKEAEARGYQMLIDAFGSPQAYNLYTFAERFQPGEIRLFFAGEGTFWTDLSRFEELGAAKLLSDEGDK